MGIKGLTTFAKERVPRAFCTHPITILRGKRVAIDAANWMYATLSTAIKNIVRVTNLRQDKPCRFRIVDEWLILASKNINNWLSNHITPVLVFDGPAPSEKDDTKKYRRQRRQNLKDIIDQCYATIEADPNCDESVITTLRSALQGNLSMTTEEFTQFKSFFQQLGIPCLEAAGDGERLCCMLCREGKVTAVYSNDTDTMAYGSPLSIRSINYTRSRITIDCIRTDYLLEGLNLTHAQFVDLCIMSGCDYNNNMPGIASVRSYDLIQKYGSIDRLPDSFETECLNYQRCRELFQLLPSEQLLQESCSLNVKFNGIPVSLLEDSSQKLELELNKFAAKASTLITPSDGFPRELNINVTGVKRAPRIRLNIISANMQQLAI